MARQNLLRSGRRTKAGREAFTYSTHKPAPDGWSVTVWGPAGERIDDADALAFIEAVAEGDTSEYEPRKARKAAKRSSDSGANVEALAAKLAAIQEALDELV